MTVRSPGDLLAAVPYLLGFHPTDSVVVVALRGTRLVFAARADLPPPGAAADVARYVAAVVAEQGVAAATVIGYGPAGPVDAAVPAFRAALADRSLRVMEALRAHDGRFWSYLCQSPLCCPPEGTPYDPATSLIAAVATYAGHAVLPDRAALAGQVAPVTGAARESMRRATAQARDRLVELLGGAPAADVLGGRVVRAAGERAVAALLERGPAGVPPDDDELAWLTVLLSHVPVRDAAWRRTTGEEWQLSLWSEVARRAQPELVAAPASLLAFGAWLAGHGALANVALDRALGEQPDYSMACLLRDALDRGVSPSMLDVGGEPGGPGWSGREWPGPAGSGRSGFGLSRRSGRLSGGRRASRGRRGSGRRQVRR
jgi:hypothetical protein